MATDVNSQAVDTEDLDLSGDSETPTLTKAIDWSETVATILYKKAEEITDLVRFCEGTADILQQSRERLAENVEGEPIEAIDEMIDQFSQITDHVRELSETADDIGPTATRLRDALTSFQSAAEGHKTARGRVLNPDWLLDDE